MAIDQPAFIPTPWASEGSYATIPETTSAEGRASWAVGFPEKNATPLKAGGIPPHWLDFQGAFHALSQHLFFQQSGSLYEWSATLDYNPGAHILGSNGNEYTAVAASGPNSGGAVDPVADDGSHWRGVTTIDARVAPRFAVYGGQIANLRRDLLAPNKPVGISLVGDSITWGAKPTDMVVYSESQLSDHTLFQPRQSADTESWANLFRNWLEENLRGALNYTNNRLSGGGYLYEVDRADSDWVWDYTTPDPSKPGRSRSIFTLDQELAFTDGYFTQKKTGAVATLLRNDQNNDYAPNYRLNNALQFEVDLTSASNRGGVEFDFYGDAFTLYWYAENSASMPYEILVDGVQLTGSPFPTITTESGEEDIDVVGNTQTAHRTHTLPSRTADPNWPSLTALTPRRITIRSYMSSAGTGTGKLILQSIVVPKVVTFNNNGISGSSVHNFRATAAPANGYTEAQNIAAYRTAVNPGDYVLMMFGANDRAEPRNGSSVTDPYGWEQELAAEAKRVSDYAGCNVILMCSNPCATRADKDYMNMDEVHRRIIGAARENKYDYIDNFDIFSGIEMSVYTADNLHPNDAGHAAIFQNIIGSLLLAPSIEEQLAATVISGPNAQLAIQNTEVERGTVPAADKVASLRFTDKNGTTGVANTTGFVRSFVNADGSTTLTLVTYKNAVSTSAATVSIVYPASGAPYVLNDLETRTTGTIVASNDIRFSTSASAQRIFGYSGSGEDSAGKNGVSVMAGSETQYGAHLDLVGKIGTPSGDTPDPDAGAFKLTASVGTTSTYVHTLQGTAAGDLTWDGLEVQTSSSPSDERIKTALADIPDAVLDAWGDVKWGQFQFLKSIEEKGNEARLHVGLIAQRIQAAFESHGLDACEYGIICHDVWDNEYTEDADGNTVLFRPAGDLWTLRYLEALAIEAAYQRRQAARLEARVTALEIAQPR